MAMMEWGRRTRTRRTRTREKKVWKFAFRGSSSERDVDEGCCVRDE